MSSVWRHSSRWFVAGLVLGAGVVAAGLTAAGAVLGITVPLPVRMALLLLALFTVGAFEVAGQADRLPQNRRLVPQTIVASDAVAGPLQFGFEMGTGMRTFAPSALPLGAVAIALLWSPGALEGLALGLGFAAGRALAIPARRVDPERWDRRITGTRLPTRLVLTAAFALAAADLLRH